VGSLLRDRSGPAVVLLGAYAAAGGALAWTALGWETGPDGDALSTAERLRRAARVTAFGSVWMAAVPAALWRLTASEGGIRYDKMAHGVEMV
jgi:hypothetical protein